MTRCADISVRLINPKFMFAACALVKKLVVTPSTLVHVRKRAAVPTMAAISHVLCIWKRLLTLCCPANTKHLYDICAMLVQRRRRWADVVQMLFKCFVFARC